MFKLYGHGGSENHGCEAIVRTTAKLINVPMTLFSSHPEQDKKYGVDKLYTLQEDNDVFYPRGSREWFL